MGRAPIQIKKTAQPDVILDILWQAGVLSFVLENISENAVHNVRVAFKRKVIGQGGTVNIADLPFWSTLAFMPPRRRIELPIDRADVFFAHNKTGPLGISITYSDNQTTWRGQYSLDFAAYKRFPDMRIRRD